MAKQNKISTFLPEPGIVQDKSNFSQSSDVATLLELNLVNHFLIAMPSIADPVFGGTVIYLCEHNANGALGVIINKPTDMTLDVLFERIDLEPEHAYHKILQETTNVMFGGPVQGERGFVLHTISVSGPFSSTMPVSEEIALTTSKDVLEAVASGQGPQQFLVSLGCSGWGAGQLEDEIGKNGWLTVLADPHIIFDLPIEERFLAAIRLLGIDPMMLANEAGHA
jgi:putative transcriptional regulator